MRVRGLGTLSLRLRYVKAEKEKKGEEILSVGIYSQNNDITYLEMMLDLEQERKRTTFCFVDVLCILESAKWPSERKDPLFTRRHHIPNFLLLNFNFYKEDFWDWDLREKGTLTFQIRGKILDISGCLKAAAQLLQKAVRGETVYPE